MAKLIDVAHWFLSRDAMTHKKLQKLCYYAQAWYCTLYGGNPLFEDRIEAWVHGPVVPELHPYYTDYRWNEIPMRECSCSLTSSFTENEIRVLEAVYNTYGSFTGDQLERLTHSELPWKDARGDLNPWESCTKEITVASMRSYYSKQYEQTQND